MIYQFKMGDYEIEVKREDGKVVLITDGRDTWRDDYSYLVLSRAEAMDLGGLLAGMATDLEVE